METLDEKFNRMKFALKSLLSKQKHLCTTCDVWTCRGQSYLGITVHFIDENYKRQSFVLAFKQLYLRQTYKYLAKNIDAVLKDFELTIDQLTRMVTDGGSALCKMFSRFGEKKDTEIQSTAEFDSDSDDESPSNSTQATNRNGSASTTNRNEDGDDESESDAPTFMQNSSGELFQSEILDFENDSTAQPVDEYFGATANTEKKIVLPPQRRCHSHICNLVCQKFEKELPPNAAKVFKSVYNKLHCLWCICNRSARAKTICKEVLGRVLKVPCETRWNSKFDCIKLIFELLKRDSDFDRNIINVLIRRLKLELKSAHHLQTIEQSDFIVIGKYIAVMEPVACALDTLQGEFNCSQGYILPALLTMKHHISRIETSSNIDIDFKRTMLKV